MFSLWLPYAFGFIIQKQKKKNLTLYGGFTKCSMEAFAVYMTKISYICFKIRYKERCIKTKARKKKNIYIKVEKKRKTHMLLRDMSY